MWTYEQKTGRLLDAVGKCLWTGYAGRDLDGHQGKNNPEMQNVKGIGPLPVGIYTITEPLHSDTVGPYAMRLEPYPTNRMFGRASFYIHGDSIAEPGTASHGCIIMPRYVRQDVWESDDHDLRVVHG